MICDSHTLISFILVGINIFFLKSNSYVNLQTENLSIQSVVKYFTLMKI